MNYYYFAATLPAVTMTGAPAWSLTEFVTAAERQLAPADARELLLVLSGHGTSAFARAARARRHRLDALAARLRAGNRGVEVPPEPEGVPDLALGLAVQDAFAAPDPLERQRRLDALWWQFCAEVREAAPFAVEAVFAYGLMLQLAWQWQPRTHAAGEAALAEQRQRLLAAFAAIELTMAGGPNP